MGAEYRPRPELAIGDRLGDGDRELLEVVGSELDLEGLVTYRPGAALKLSELAWAGKDEGHAFNPGEEPDPWFDPFVRAAGGGELVAATTIHNGEPTPVHVDNWTNALDTVPDLRTALVVFRRGSYTGMEYALVDYGLAFDFADGDVFVAPSSLRHGNLPRLGDDYDRLAVIMALDLR
jgi:hypothetical protein